MEDLAGREAARARARQRHGRVRGGGRGGGEAGGRTPAGRYRGPAYGRDERGRGPVRVGQDVSAAGGKERPRDEEGRRLPRPLYRGGPGGGPPVQRHGGDGDREGRRARH